MHASTRLLAFVVAIAGISSQLFAADGLCDHCGCNACLRRVCVPKPVEKEIVKVCWDYKCEEICVPGPSTYCGEKCQEDKCGCWSFKIWKPGCAEVRTRRVPVKTEVKRKVPGVEWVVEYRCEACCQGGCASCQSAGASLPAAQATAATLPPASAVRR